MDTNLTTCFESTPFLALTTSNAEGETWACPVFFAYDDRFQLYFISQPSSRHMEYLAANPQVSAAIYSTAQDPAGDVCGIQLRGTATILPDEEVPAAFDLYYQRSPRDVVEESRSPEDHMGPDAKWKFVRVTPTEMHYFDTAQYGEDRVEVPQELYN